MSRGSGRIGELFAATKDRARSSGEPAAYAFELADGAVPDRKQRLSATLAAHRLTTCCGGNAGRRGCDRAGDSGSRRQARKLAQGDNALAANAGYCRFLSAPAGQGFAIDPDKVAADAQFDGAFVLQTNMKLSALAVETLLATRPVSHRTDAATRGHIGCTFLALLLRKEILDRLAAHRAATPEWQHTIDTDPICRASDLLHGSPCR